MNIFALHPNPRKSARWHVDKHVIKMLLETCQLLYTAHWVLAYSDLKTHKSVIGLSRAQKKLDPPPSMATAPCSDSGQLGYRPCHVHHPCAVWTRQSSGNYHWLATLGIHLASEYQFRFGKVHSCEVHIQWLLTHLPKGIKPHPRRPFPIAMAEEYRISSNPIICYRHYYRTAKAEKGLIRYTKRHLPHWFTQKD